MRFRTVLLNGILAFLGLMFLNCPLPPVPPGPETARVELLLQSTGGQSATEVSDSIGKLFNIGVILYQRQHLELTEIKVFNGSSIEYDSTIGAYNVALDTVFFPITFSSAGDRSVLITGHITGYPDVEASGVIHVIGPSSGANRKPTVLVPATKLVIAGETLTLAVTTSDPDAGQTVDVVPLNAPEGASFAMDTLFWTTALENVGTHTIIFIGTDNGTPALSDTDTTIVTVSATTVNRAPEWMYDTIEYSARPETPLSFPLSIRCSDPDGDELTYSLLPGTPATDTVVEASWLFTPATSDTGMHLVAIVAADPAGESDTLIIKLTIGLNVTSPDADCPTMHLIAPSVDSQTIASSTSLVTIACSDESGVASVECSMGATVFPTEPSSDSLYSATVTGLQPSVWNTVRFIAADDAFIANRCTLYVSLMYDPEAPDLNPPSITLVSPSTDTVVGIDSCLIRVRCSDENGIAQVTIGGVPATAGDNNVFSATVTGLVAGTTTVTIVATDAAPAANTDSVTVGVTYNNDASGPSIALVTPESDSVATNASSYTVTLACTDPSGVVSVNGVRDGTTFTGVHGSGNNWEIAVSGLAEGVYSAIVFTATDGSPGANANRKTLYIKYDPTMDDVDGPTISQVSGPESGDIVSTAQVTIVDTIHDPSGIGEVTWSIDGGVSKPMTPVAGKPGQYTLTAPLSGAGTHTIVVIAVDNSSGKNDSKQTIGLQYVIAPGITGQPGSTDVCPGEEVTVSLTATGTPPLHYQWHDANGPISGATDNQYQIASAAATTTLTCVVTNDAAESATSNPCIITVNPGVIITQQPKATTNSCPGTDATISVKASGGSGLTYQWYKGTPPNGTVAVGSDFSGGTTASLKITGKSITEGSYYCVVTNSNGCSATSTAGVYAMNNAVSVALTSTSTSTCTGTNVTFTATPTGGMSHQYQWYRNGIAIGTPSATPTYATATAGTYHCTATSSAGCVGTSNEVALTVTAPPSVQIAGPTAPVCEGSSGNFSVTASGGSGFSYQWFSGTPPNTSSPISGETTSSLTRSQAGSYFCRVTNSSGCVGYSTAASLSVTSLSVTAPSNVTACALNEVVLSVTATAGATGYQWYKENTGGSDRLLTDVYDYRGTTTNTLRILATLADTSHSGKYYCIVRAGTCTFKSASGTVTVKDGPRIARQPESVTVPSGDALPLSVGLEGTGGEECPDQYTYRWYHDGDPNHPVFDGGGAACVVFIMPTTGRAGTYYCVITNPVTGCSVTSDTITVTEQ